MSILNDEAIRKLALDHGMLTPFIGQSVSAVTAVDGSVRKVLSYGLSSFGYDLRLAGFRFTSGAQSGGLFEYLTPGETGALDPKGQEDLRQVDLLLQTTDDKLSCYWELPANSWALGVSMERICMPSDVMAICTGKSSYARCGVFCNVTPVEPGWEGFLTIEVANLGRHPVRIWANEGIVQLVFFQGERAKVSYRDRGGKYQNQPRKPVPAFT